MPSTQYFGRPQCKVDLDVNKNENENKNENANANKKSTQYFEQCQHDVNVHPDTKWKMKIFCRPNSDVALKQTKKKTTSTKRSNEEWGWVWHPKAMKTYSVTYPHIRKRKQAKTKHKWTTTNPLWTIGSLLAPMRQLASRNRKA